MNTNTRTAAAVAPIVVMVIFAAGTALALAIIFLAAALRHFGCPAYLSFSIAASLCFIVGRATAWALRYAATRH